MGADHFSAEFLLVVVSTCHEPYFISHSAAMWVIIFPTQCVYDTFADVRIKLLFVSIHCNDKFVSTQPCSTCQRSSFTGAHTFEAAKCKFCPLSIRCHDSAVRCKRFCCTFVILPILQVCSSLHQTILATMWQPTSRIHWNPQKLPS